VHALHYANELLLCVRLSFQKLLQTRSTCRNNKKNVWDKSSDTLIVDKSTDHAKPHFDLFFTTMSTSKKMFFFRARAEKDIARHNDASSMVLTLIDNGKLANQIARLGAIVVKLGLSCQVQM